MAKRNTVRTRPASANTVPFPDRRQTIVADGADDSGLSNDTSSSDASSGDTRSVSMSSEPSEEAIRLRAYQRYLARGGQDGMDFDDWLEAEEELRNAVKV